MGTAGYHSKTRIERTEKWRGNAFTATIAIILLQSRRRSLQTRKASIPLAVPITPPRNLADKKTSTTLDLTLLLLVRALDSFVQGLFLQSNAQPKSNNWEEDRQKSKQLRQKAAILTDKLDAFIFWAASARIMWCFFYLPERLPYSYVKWIGALANVDKRLLEALRGRRNGTWTYGNETFHELLVPLATELGYPPAWGDTMLVPSSGRNADKMWKALGLSDREGIGGIPCQLVHGNVGSTLIKGGAGASCTANALIRGALGFLEAIAIYAPVHFLPILLSRPNGLLQIRVLKKAIYALFRSSLFLSVFISSIWSAVCITRTLAIPRLFPRLSHNFIDGPYGCVLAGCLMCGGSIWIEQGKRRGEIALYVLPRALRTILEESWLKSGSRSLILLERLTFVLSLSSIMTAARHYPETLRGLSRWGHYLY
ncbi:integral membrane [Pyrrhoderma noxium]|uniref:Integral membrane n=1 Tax=Pyrrhoderma noxium TaxID=2282107 RepID=A0A286US38_9AGAM|nr:integral membrane [Pyrrhoderma noxium]